MTSAQGLLQVSSTVSAFAAPNAEGAYLAFGLSVLALVFGAGLWAYLKSQNRGSPKMVEIADAVRQGAGAFLSREYRIIAPVAVLFVVLIFGLID